MQFEDNNFIKCKPFELVDILTLGFYSLFTTWVYCLPYQNETERLILMGYSILPPLFLIVFYYTYLRNIKVWLIWFMISIMHIWMANSLEQYPSLKMQNGTAFSQMYFTWLTLLLYQLTRWISLKLQGREWVVPSRDGIDLYDKRKVTFLDCILFMILFITSTLLPIFWHKVFSN